MFKKVFVKTLCKNDHLRYICYICMLLVCLLFLNKRINYFYQFLLVNKSRLLGMGQLYAKSYMRGQCLLRKFKPFLHR